MDVEPFIHGVVLYVTGGNSGEAYVYDAETGEKVAALQLTHGGEGVFINDVIVTRTGAYFTNSFQSEIYRLPLGANATQGSRIQDAAAPVAIGCHNLSRKLTHFYEI